MVSVNEDRNSRVLPMHSKNTFVEHYFMGEKPGAILRSAGFDLKILRLEASGQSQL